MFILKCYGSAFAHVYVALLPAKNPTLTSPLALSRECVLHDVAPSQRV